MLSLSGVFGALLTVTLLIALHELGHFLVAKACGVRVRVFSVGFGSRLFGVKVGETDYRVSALPLGGYVRMAGSDPFGDSGARDEEDADDDPRAPGAFLAAPVWKRILIVAAGPVMNLLLPFVVFTGVLMVGEEQAVAIVGEVTADSPAAKAGLLPEDHVLAVNGAAVTTWNDVVDAMDAAVDPVTWTVAAPGGAKRAVTLRGDVGSGGAPMPWDYGVGMMAPGTVVVIDDAASPAGRSGLRSGGQVLAVDGVATKDWHDVARAVASADAKGATALKVRWQAAPTKEQPQPAPQEATLVADASWQPTVTSADAATWLRWGLACAETSIGVLEEGSAGAKAGLQLGDHLLMVDDAPVRAWSDLLKSVASSATGKDDAMTARAIRVTVRREGALVALSLTPNVVRDSDLGAVYRWRPKIGVGSLGEFAEGERVRRPYPLPQAFSRAVKETTLLAKGMVAHIGKMLTNQADVRKSMGGFVEISRQSAAAAERGVLVLARNFGMLSISLGVVNLLPVPVLDGGQLLLYVAEWVRGRPLPLALRERLQQVGVLFLVALTLFAFVNDLSRCAGNG